MEAQWPACASGARAASASARASRPGADVCRDGGDLRQAVGEGREIEAGAARDDGVPSGLAEPGQDRLGLAQPAADGPTVGGVRHPHQVVRNAAALGEIGDRGQDREVAVDLKGVGTDHLAAHGFGQADGQG